MPKVNACRIVLARRWLGVLGLVILISFGGLTTPAPAVAASEEHFTPGSTSQGPLPQTLPDSTTLQGPAGSRFQLSGSRHRPFAPVVSIKLGKIEILGNRTINTDEQGSFTVPDLVVPNLEPGIYPLVVTVGSGNLETTATTIFRVTDSLQPTIAISTGLAPLLDGGNLERVFNFDNQTKTWLFFDPRPAFAESNSLTSLQQQAIYWIKVQRDQVVALNGRSRNLTCVNEATPQENCWNQIVW